MINNIIIWAFSLSLVDVAIISASLSMILVSLYKIFKLEEE